MCKQSTVVFSFVASVFSFVSAFSPSNVFAADHYTHFYYAPDAYIGINLSAMEIAEDGIEDAEVAAICGRLGKQYNHYLSAEFRLGYGLGNQILVDPILGSDIEFKVQEFYGAYVRLGVPSGDRFYPYLLVGYSQIGLEQTSLGVTTDDKIDDISYGIGADWALRPHMQTSLELVRYADKQGSTLTSLSLGFAKAF